MKLFDKHGVPAMCSHLTPESKGKKVEQWKFYGVNDWSVIQTSPEFGTLAECNQCHNISRWFDEMSQTRLLVAL